MPGVRQRLFVIFFAALFLAGCQTTTNPLVVEKYSVDPRFKLPPISLFALEPSEELKKTCVKHRCYRRVGLFDDVYGELKRSNVFESVVYNDKSLDYGVYLTIKEIDQSGVVEQSLKGAIAGASLLLVPVSFEREYRAEIITAWHGYKLAEYSFSTPYKDVVSLYNSSKESSRHVAESFVSRFLYTAQADGVFDSDHLYATVKASDYQNGLHLPHTFENFQLYSSQLLGNPMYGALATYRHALNNTGRYDVFVYPIPKLVWDKTDEVLKEEFVILGKEMDLAVKKGIYQSFEMGDSESFEFKQGDRRFVGLQSAGKIIDNSGGENISFSFLFIQKDKFIKFRLSMPASDGLLEKAEIEAFVKVILSKIDVPEESLFMAEMRQNQRTSAIK